MPMIILLSCDKVAVKQKSVGSVDSIIVYKKWSNSNEDTNSIQYYSSNIDTSKVAYLQVAKKIIPLYRNNIGGLNYTVYGEKGYTLTTMLYFHNEFLHFKKGLLLDENKKVLDTLCNNVEPILYLDNKRIDVKDSLSMNSYGEPIEINTLE